MQSNIIINDQGNCPKMILALIYLIYQRDMSNSNSNKIKQDHDE